MVDNPALEEDNYRGIKEKGANFDLQQFSNSKSPPVVEKEWAIERVLKGLESSAQLAKRLDFKYDTLRKWIQRHKKNPNTITSQFCGRPTKLAAVKHRKTKVVALTYKAHRRTVPGLGGAALGDAIYGELTEPAMDIVCDKISLMLGSDTGSFMTESRYRIFEVGAGAGKALLHMAARLPGLKSVIGIEYVPSRAAIALKVLRTLIQSDSMYTAAIAPANIILIDLLDIPTIRDYFDVIYAFDVGFPSAPMKKLACLWNESQKVQVLVSFFDIKALNEFGFRSLRLHTQHSLPMHGSRSRHIAYFYARLTPSFIALYDYPLLHKRIVYPPSPEENELLPPPIPLDNKVDVLLRESIELCENIEKKQQLLEYISQTEMNALKTTEEEIVDDVVVKRSLRNKKNNIIHSSLNIMFIFTITIKETQYV